MKIKQIMVNPEKVTACWWVEKDEDYPDGVERKICPFVAVVTRDNFYSGEKIDEIIPVFFVDGKYIVAEEDDDSFFLGFEHGDKKRDWDKIMKIRDSYKKRKT